MTDRQRKYFRLIVEEYILTGDPVGSEHFLTKNNLDVSSATIRNEMNTLEKEGYLEKAHSSGGRIPTLKGYTFYAQNLAEKKSKNLQSRLEDVFAKRRISIDVTLDEAVNTISEITGLTLALSSSHNEELMKSIQLTPLNEKFGTIVIVTSSGKVESKLIEFNAFVKVEDVRIAVRIFKERLIDTKLSDLPMKVEKLALILSERIKDYESIIQAFIGKVFDFHNRVQNKVFGNSHLIQTQEIAREDLAKLLDLIEHKSIWETIEGQISEDETLKIDIRPNNTSLISKKINYGHEQKELTIVGSNRMGYAEAKQAIKIIEDFLQKRR